LVSASRPAVSIDPSTRSGFRAPGFVVLRVAPESWFTQLAPDHPFLRVNGDRLAAYCVPPAVPGG
jgi:hypothetical protein